VKNSNSFLLMMIATPIPEIQQNFDSKETYVTVGKSAAIVFHAWVQRYPSQP